MKLTWIGTSAFYEHMPNHGYEVAFIRMSTPRAMDWRDICEDSGFEPDAVVYSDRSLPLPLVGVEDYPAITAFHVVDSHIHSSWYPTYAAAFDCRGVSLLDHMDAFDNPEFPGSTIWMPPFARDPDRILEGIKKEWDVVFVGNVDPVTTPKRVEFLDELERLLPGRIQIAQGKYLDLYAKSRIVLNISERGDLNYRIFEALACGACLLTPKVGHGLHDLFPPGECFETYTELDPADAAAKIESLLADPARCQAMASAGHAVVNKAHRKRNRAEELDALLRSDGTRTAHAARMAKKDRMTRDLRLVYLHWANSVAEEHLRVKYLAAAKGQTTI